MAIVVPNAGAEEAVFQWSGQRLLKAAAVALVEGTGPSEKSGGYAPQKMLRFDMF